MTVLTRLLFALLRYPKEPADPHGSPGSVRVISASPRYLAYRIVRVWSRLFVLFALEELLIHASSKHDGSFSEKLGVFLVIFGIPGLIASFFTYAEYVSRSYKLSDRALRIREGLFTIRETTMTFANIQNVSVSRGPLQGLFGISDVVLKTAGGGATDQKRGLARDLHVAHFQGLRNADEVRELVLELLKKSREAGLGDADDAPAPASTAASLPRVLVELREAATAFRKTAERIAT